MSGTEAVIFAAAVVGCVVVLAWIGIFLCRRYVDGEDIDLFGRTPPMETPVCFAGDAPEIMGGTPVPHNPCEECLAVRRVKAGRKLVRLTSAGLRSCLYPRRMERR
jgi:hypothetical protein